MATSKVSAGPVVTSVWATVALGWNLVGGARPTCLPFRILVGSAHPTHGLFFFGRLTVKQGRYIREPLAQGQPHDRRIEERPRRGRVLRASRNTIADRDQMHETGRVKVLRLRFGRLSRFA
jgi:hypothetical protein